MNDGSGLDGFDGATRAWFGRSFGEPTAVQREAWPAIRAGGHVLLIAPTGSGKTLAAFLWAIDRLMRQAAPSHGVSVLYISPLKALGVDVAKNLREPLAGISEECARRGRQTPAVRIAIRSGDTTPRERRAISTHPPNILVTTPESLYLLLTSQARRILRTVHTVIVDEVHAMVGTKRGAHLALSLERLDRLTGHPAQRIGLSATVRPPGEAAHFLGGAMPVRVIAPGSRPSLAVRVVEPLADMRDRSQRERAAGDEDRRARAGGSLWPSVERSVLREVLRHRTTLVFVNSRGLAERLTARLNDLYADNLAHQGYAKGGASRDGASQRDPPRHLDPVIGPTTEQVHSTRPEATIAMAHHGSVSKERRARIEADLKAGRLRCVVATSSLELGIDMGSIDLVIQIAPPLSVAPTTGWAASPGR